MLTAFFRSVPGEILEAAEIDGAGSIRRFLTIGVPLARPALSTLTALSLWNELLFSLLITQDPSKRTLTVGVSLLKPSFSKSPSAVVLTPGLAISIIPPLLLFLLFLLANRSLMRGLVGGALK